MKAGPQMNSEQAAIEAMAELLSQEVQLHEDLRGELTREKELDGSLNGPQVLRVQQRKYHLVGRIEALEAQRMTQVRELARQWEEPVEALTLRRIIERSADEQAGQLSGYHQALVSLLEEIGQLARETGANAQARLKAVEATLSIVGEAARVHPTYSGRGRIQQKPPAFKSTSA